MVEVVKELVTKEERTHIFKCDNCGELLGTSPEHEDGWARSIGEVTGRASFEEIRLSFKGNLCSKCRDKVIDNFYDVIKHFIKENGLEAEEDA